MTPILVRSPRSVTALTGWRDTKYVRRPGPHDICAASDVEYSRLGTLRVAGVPLFHGPSGARRSPVPSRPRWVTAKQRVKHRKRGSQRGCNHGAWRARTSGTQVVSRLGRLSERTPTVRPDSRDFGPLPGSIGAADCGDTKSARGDLASFDSPHLARTGLCAPPRFYVALLS